MSKAPRAFRQRDLTRALKASIAAEVTPISAKIDREGNTVLGFDGEPPVNGNGWDRALGLCHNAHRPQVIRPGGGT
jgi:hypothetical protein